MFFKLPLLPFFAFAALVLVLTSCEAPVSNETVAVPAEASNLGTTGKADAVILPFDTNNLWLTEHIFPKTLSTAKLNSAELKLIDSLMETFVTNYNLTEAPKKWEAHQKSHPKDTSKLADFTFDMKAYKKQYMAVSNAKDEKEVWVNCFCKSIEETIEFKDWKDYVVRVYDGGKCFFNIKLNLTRREVYDFMINTESEKHPDKKKPNHGI